MKRVAVVVAILLLSPVGAVALDDGSLDNGDHLVYANDSTSVVYATDNGSQWQNDDFTNIAGVSVIENESATSIYVYEAEQGNGTTILDSDGNVIHNHNYTKNGFRAFYTPVNNTHYLNVSYQSNITIEGIWSDESHEIPNTSYSFDTAVTDEIIVAGGNDTGTNYTTVYDRSDQSATTYTFTNETTYVAADNDTAIVLTEANAPIGIAYKVYKIENGSVNLIDSPEMTVNELHSISNDRYFTLGSNNVSIYQNGSLEMRVNTTVDIFDTDSYGVEDGTIYGYVDENDTIITVNHTSGKVSNLTQPDITAMYVSIDSYEAVESANETNETTPTSTPVASGPSSNIFGLPQILGNISGVPFYLIGAALTVVGVVIFFYFDGKLATTEYIE